MNDEYKQPIVSSSDVITDDMIEKEAILGFVVIERENPKKSTERLVTVRDYLSYSWLQECSQASLIPGEKVISILPAAPGTYRVRGRVKKEGDNEQWETLGVEIDGAYKPDWKKELKSRIAERKGGEKFN